MVRSSYAVLLALALAVGVSFQGTRGLYESSEGRYAEVAREMRETGSWLEPTLAYQPHWTKPPLTYWAIAAGLAAVGDDAWGVRAYNIVAFALTALAVAAIGAALWDPTTGWLAGLVYLSSPYPVAAMASATTDTLLAMWVALAVLGYARAWRGARPQAWVCGMWVAFGAGFFTKGPPALLPLVALCAFHWRAGRPFRLAEPIGLALFAAIGLWWYALVIARHPELASYFLGEEVVRRVASGEFERNAQWYGAFTTYGPVLLFGPGLWVAPATAIARRERLLDPRRVGEALPSRGSVGALLLWWLGLPLAVFALSRSRMPLYLLPVYPAVALAIARGLAARFGEEGVRRRVYGLAGVSIALLVATKGVLAFVPTDRDATRVYREAVIAAGPEARFALFAESHFHGFQFHAGGRAERLSATGIEPWADRTLEVALADLDPARPYAIVARERHAPELEAALRAKSLPFRRATLPGKTLFVIGARPDRSADAGLPDAAAR